MLSHIQILQYLNIDIHFNPIPTILYHPKQVELTGSCHKDTYVCLQIKIYSKQHDKLDWQLHNKHKNIIFVRDHSCITLAHF